MHSTIIITIVFSDTALTGWKRTDGATVASVYCAMRDGWHRRGKLCYNWGALGAHRRRYFTRSKVAWSWPTVALFYEAVYVVDRSKKVCIVTFLSLRPQSKMNITWTGVQQILLCDQGHCRGSADIPYLQPMWLYDNWATHPAASPSFLSLRPEK